MHTTLGVQILQPLSCAQTPEGVQNPIPPEITFLPNSSKNMIQSRAVVENKDINIDFDPATRNILPAFENIYCLLELISEQGSGGLVNKVIIAQDSLGRFINKLRPGAYRSLTKVDFKALDSCLVQPIGVYGPREAIVSFLVDLCIISDRRAPELLSTDDGQELLKPGLYIAMPSQVTSHELYVVFWPERDTWRDDAISSVHRNRVTFMRYLTKMTHQIICLFTEEDSRSFVWHSNAESTEETDHNEDEPDDRMFSFEVSKTLEQEENITLRQGFNSSLPHESLKAASVSFMKVSEKEMDPVMLSGETSQGFLTIHFVPSRSSESKISRQTFTQLKLSNFLDTGRIKLDPKVDLNAIKILIDVGLTSRFPDLCNQFKKRKESIDAELKALKTAKVAQFEQELAADNLEDIILFEFLRRMEQAFPSCNFNSLNDRVKYLKDESATRGDPFANLILLYPSLLQEFDREYQKLQSVNLKNPWYLDLKRKLITIEYLFEQESGLNPEKKDHIVNLIFADTDPKNVDSFKKSTWIGKIKSLFTEQITRSRYLQSSEKTFLMGLSELSRFGDNIASGHVSTALRLASLSFEGEIQKSCNQLQRQARNIQHEILKKQIDARVAQKRGTLYEEWRSAFLHDLDSTQDKHRIPSLPARRMIYVNNVEIATTWHFTNMHQGPSFTVSAKEQTFVDPILEYKIHTFELTADHRQNLQLDPNFVPKPHIDGRFSSSFQLPRNQRILHGQLLSNDRLLLVIDDQCGTIFIFLEFFSNIGNAVKNRRHRKAIRQEKTGKDVMITFDETRRMIALYACAKAQLYIFVFDETFTSLESWARPLDLTRYDANSVVLHICFVTGAEELLLVDNQGHARIFSLEAQQFRPASLTFRQMPLSIHPSPDGACFLARFGNDATSSLRAYHWTTFGSNDGIQVDADPSIFGNGMTLSSLVNRCSVHLVLYDFKAEQCSSIALDITKKATEFIFQERSLYQRTSQPQRATVNNCLLDCYDEVWTRFPVLPAIQRYTKTSTNNYLPKRIICVTSQDSLTVASYFTMMVGVFERKTRKPTGSELRSIVVESLTFDGVITELSKRMDELISRFYAGGWVVDILCLIPIHLAITRENRFIPLKDGVISSEYERSLLGAEINTVVDSISFGWYESILQSYMATKPIKVVSSMGEQSVGKSYALNHLVDTSFAGSAMRTTEGVWMSITPTDDVLLVALDFEGVHSIERSAQEDTLLVLFNTAISNLVLFRNNFALSRDITGLFQSFQSSSAVFDPAANPTLFRSKLVIIIKDVVDSDTNEIVREFSLKFQKIVQDEQKFNFISCLHNGQLDIVPWSVIESKKFYNLFLKIKTLLDKQPVTHGNGVSFLRAMKTLMAKLKANDWRALSQSMAGHRAHHLLSVLPNALAFGYSEIEPGLEPLKDIDTDIEIGFIDTDSRFLLSGLENASGDRDAHLMKLCETWTRYKLRSESNDADWVQGLSAYLTHLVDTRVNYVQAWISKNLQSFNQSSHASITALNRTFDATVIDLRANAELCKQQCDSCDLFCLLNRRHLDDGRAHDCLTSHKCSHHCEYQDKLPETNKTCGHRAGHSGRHVCVVEDHLCGEPCILKSKPGCLGACTSLVGHKEQEHRCSSRVHACGMPCQLSIGPLTGGILRSSGVYICRGTCTMSSETPHDKHVCDNRMCPIKCELCNRLCSTSNHLHSLHPDAVHLCGEIHICQSLCSADGVCDIDIVPQSIEATFTGRHETFQYTKYSQIAKRLSCVVPIPAMQRSHAGRHSHTADPTPFHFCKTQCLYCGYYCTLPRGHSQQDHETSHGSMSRTRWAVEDPDAVVELNGRKFGSDDDGGPMMCNLFCQEMGRHVHIDYCRADSEAVCNGPDVQHINARLNPHPDRPKDWITHELFWKRSGFKDPYSRDDRKKFAKCDAICPGPEHSRAASNASQPSYCTLTMFHSPCRTAINDGLGYTTQDGHHFSCENPAIMHQAYHVIFVIDRSSSMRSSDRQPLSGTPVTRRIAVEHNNRLGAVYSSLYSFWVSRMSAVAGGHSQRHCARRDAYSVILFDHETVNCLLNDFKSSPDQLLNMILPYTTRVGTNYNLAIRCAQDIMQQYWSTERGPVVIFLSDGACSINDQDMQTLCRAAVALGKPLSFHGVSFGKKNATLRRMVQIARDIQVPRRDPLLPQDAFVESSFAEDVDSIRLAETLLGLAEALKKPRGALFN